MAKLHRTWCRFDRSRGMIVMKKIVLVVACSASLVLPSVAFADETVVAPQVQQTQDLSAVFATDDMNNLQVATLSTQEMQETEGAWVPTIVGGTLSGASYAYGAYKGHYQWNTGKFLGNVATGAVIGTFTGGAGHLASGGAKFIPSLTNTGANIWRLNGASLNWGVGHAWRR